LLSREDVELDNIFFFGSKSRPRVALGPLPDTKEDEGALFASGGGLDIGLSFVAPPGGLMYLFNCSSAIIFSFDATRSAIFCSAAFFLSEAVVGWKSKKLIIF
jgi:hypothetical protein